MLFSTPSKFLDFIKYIFITYKNIYYVKVGITQDNFEGWKKVKYKLILKEVCERDKDSSREIIAHLIIAHFSFCFDF